MAKHTNKRKIPYVSQIICLHLCILMMVLVFAPKVIESTSYRVVKVYVDNVEIDFSGVQPYVDANYRVMVPVRAPVEAVGANVDWNQERLQVTITNEDREVILKANEASYIVNGQTKQMNTSMVYSKALRTSFVPIRFVLEALGAEVTWEMDQGIDIIHVTSPKQLPIVSDAVYGMNYQGFTEALKYKNISIDLLSGPKLLEEVAEYLTIPKTFYTNSDLEYFLYRTSITEQMETDLITYLEEFQYAEQVVVLTYHHLLKKEENKRYLNNNAVMAVETFEQHIQLLHEHKYQSYDLQVLEEFIKGNIKLPRSSVFITFDDGYLSNYVYAYRILKYYNYKATIFAITSMIRDVPEEFDPHRLNFISWQETDKYKDVFSLESHTHDLHKINNNISLLITEPYQNVVNDLAESKTLINASYFAYPYGQHNRHVINALKSTGYRLAFTNSPGTVTVDSNPYQLNRFGIDPHTTIYDFKNYVGITNK